LYDEYINNDKTRDTLSDSDFFSIMNVLMQLRKVSNHPDLFEARTIESPFIMTNQIMLNVPDLIFQDSLLTKTEKNPLENLDLLKCINLPQYETMTRLESDMRLALFPTRTLQQALSDQMQHYPNFSQGFSTVRPSAVDGFA
jgi:E1A-binding protein p400